MPLSWRLEYSVKWRRQAAAASYQLVPLHQREISHAGDQMIKRLPFEKLSHLIRGILIRDSLTALSASPAMAEFATVIFQTLTRCTGLTALCHAAEWEPPELRRSISAQMNDVQSIYCEGRARGMLDIQQASCDASFRVRLFSQRGSRRTQ